MKTGRLQLSLVLTIGVVVATAPSSRAQTTNSWKKNTDGNWEGNGFWTAGTPSVSNAANFITNANPKTVAIDASTPTNTLTISNLTVSANTLRLASASSPGLHVLNNLILTNNGALLITNSAVQIDGGTNVDVFGNVGAVPIYSGSIAVQNGTLSLVSSLVVGSPPFFHPFPTDGATLTIAGGAAAMSGLYINNAIAPAFVWVTGGTLDVSTGGINVGNVLPEEGSLILSNGTVRANSLGLFNGDGIIVGGLMSANTVVIGDFFGDNGLLDVRGGTLTATNASHTGVINVAGGEVVLNGGTILADSLVVTNLNGLQFGFVRNVSGILRVDGQVLFNKGTMTVAGGTNTLAGLSLGNSPGSTGIVVLAGGELTVTNGPVIIASTGGVGRVVLSTNASPSGSAAIARDGIVPQVAGGGGSVLRANSVGLSTGAGSDGSLDLSDGGTVEIYSNLVVGDCAAGVPGQVTVSGGNLAITNAGHTAFLDVRAGQVIVSSGVLQADKLIVTNACGQFNHSGGTVTVAAADIILTPAYDADGDGIPNGYEQTHGLDPLNSVNATADSDADGLTDLQEYRAGTDPTNSASAFHITAVAREGNNIRVTWMSGAGKTNVLERSAGTAGSFSNNFAAIFAVTNTVGSVTNYVDVGAATNVPARYYRVKIVP